MYFGPEVPQRETLWLIMSSWDGIERKINPSCFLPSKLINATYINHFRMSHFTDSLTSLSNIYRATCALALPLWYFAIIHFKYHTKSTHWCHVYSKSFWCLLPKRRNKTQEFFQNSLIYSFCMYNDDSFIRTHLFPLDISGLTSLPDYWIAH